LLGGILENSEQLNINGYPGLARIPILKYLFSQENKSTSENEIVFALIPHIVRGQDFSELNNQSVDVGTANGIELRRAESPQSTQEPPQAFVRPANNVPPQPSPSAVNTPPAQAPEAGAQQNVVQGAGAAPLPPSFQQPGATPPQQQASASPPPEGTLQAGNAVLSFEPAAMNQPLNSTFVVNLSVSNAANMYSVPSQISYDPKVLQLVNVSNGGFLGKDGQPVALVHRDDPSAGTLQVTATRPPGSGGVSGQGPVFTLTFMAKSPGQATISVSRAGARDPSMQAIPVAGGQAMITVK
jgi:general secretion pathway protein D